MISFGLLKNIFADKHKSMKAFTLAEVLITLVIIGVVAAITVPTIIADYTEHERRGKVRKVYSTLANAMTRVKADAGDVFIDFEDDNIVQLSNWYNEGLRNYINTTKVCYDSTGCWDASKVKYMNGQNPPMGASNRGMGYVIISLNLMDGTLVSIDPYAAGNIRNYLKVNASGNAGYVFYFDINGERNPNTIGKDIFVSVFVSREGFVPAYRDKTRAEIEANCSKSGNGVSCIQKYLRNSENS